MPRFFLPIGAFLALITGVLVALSSSVQAAGDSPPAIPNYAPAAALEFSGLTTFQPDGKDLFVAVTLKNTSPVEETFSLGVDFIDQKSLAKDRLYTAHLSAAYTLAGDEARPVQFSVPIPSFLSGTYSVRMGANTMKGKLAGMQSVAEMTLTAKERAMLERCTLADRPFDQTIDIEQAATAEANIVCQGSWSGQGTQSATLRAALIPSQYGIAKEIATTEITLNSTGKEVNLLLTEALPTGLYRLTVTAVDERGSPLGLPATTLVTVQGRGGQISGIAETKPEIRGGKTIVPVSALVDTYAAGNYSLSLTLTSEGRACATALTLPVSASARQFTGEFIQTSDCSQPLITATLSAEGVELDRATRVLESHTPKPEVIARSMFSTGKVIGLVLTMFLGLSIAGYFFWRSRRTHFFPILFLLVAATLFGSGSEAARAAGVVDSIDFVLYCDGAICTGVADSPEFEYQFFLFHS